jgi:small-conductance mechanosensitive channel
MEGSITSLFDYFDIDLLEQICYAVVLIVAGILLSRFISRTMSHLLKHFASAQQTMLVAKLSRYFVVIIFSIAALQQLGFKLSVLLSAAGVITLAVSFAAQTSVANIISGIFIIMEKPFRLGDIITVSGTTGEVVSFDLLSVKLRTAENTLVRLPNDSLLKAPIVNLTHFPKRRFDLTLGLSYNVNIQEVRELLLDVAKKNRYSLDEPEPVVNVQNFGESTLNIQLYVWTQKDCYTKLQNAIQQEIIDAFRQHHIELPYPQRDLHVISMPSS